MTDNNPLISSIKIIDATLREGMQAPGVYLDAEQNIEIALMLFELGVETIECGHPAVSRNETARIRAVRDALKGKEGTNVLCHSRANEKDIDAVASLGVEWIGIFMGLNHISLSARLSNWSREQALLCVENSVTFAVSSGLKVRFTIEDASRTDVNEAIEAYRIALSVGASRICFADTVGLLSPAQTTKWILALRFEFPNVPIEVHFHDDRGLAIANTLAALEAGATWVATSVNGLGERCGIVDLMALLANLEYMGIRKIHNPDLIQHLSRKVSAYSRSLIDDRRPVTGRNAFVHTSKLHQRAQCGDHKAYEWLPPERVGRAHMLANRSLLRDVDVLTEPAVAISVSKLNYHQTVPGILWAMIDERLVNGYLQYCIVHPISRLKNYDVKHVDTHVYDGDSLFLFIGEDEGLRGLKVELDLSGAIHIIESPANLFIPAGLKHSYRVITGQGFIMNHVFSSSYNSGLHKKNMQETIIK